MRASPSASGSCSGSPTSNLPPRSPAAPRGSSATGRRSTSCGPTTLSCPLPATWPSSRRTTRRRWSGCARPASRRSRARSTGARRGASSARRAATGSRSWPILQAQPHEQVALAVAVVLCGEAERLVHLQRRCVRLVDVELDAAAAPLTREVDDGLDDGAADAAVACVLAHEEVLQQAVLRRPPQAVAE